jgi:Periplasmic binding protein
MFTLTGTTPAVSANFAPAWRQIGFLESPVRPSQFSWNGVYLNSGAASSDVTGKACTPNAVHWAYDTYALANGTGKAVVKAGGDSWFFLTADYAFGHALQRDTTAGAASLAPACKRCYKSIL